MCRAVCSAIRVQYDMEAGARIYARKAIHLPEIESRSSNSLSQCSTVVRNCCKCDVASQWEIAIFGHLGL